MITNRTYHSTPKFTTKEVTTPAGFPVTTTEVKSWLKIGYDNDDNLFLNTLIPSATKNLERYLGLKFITRTLRTSVIDFDEYIELPFPPHQTVNSVKRKYKATVKDLTEETDYYLSGTCPVWQYSIYPNNVYKTSIGTIPYEYIIEYIAGYGTADDVPAEIKAALLEMVANAYENRGAGLDYVDTYITYRVKQKVNHLKEIF